MLYFDRLTILIATAFCFFLFSSNLDGDQTGKPNILIISLDDMNDWIGPMGGHPQAQTPHLDTFSKSAVTFRRAYTVSPSCNPSRTAMFSGKAPWITGLYNNPQTWRHVVGDELMMPEYFREAGYWTGGAGKIYHGNMPDPKGWDDYYPSLLRHMPEYWLPARDEETGEVAFQLTDNEIREDSPTGENMVMPPFEGMYLAFDFSPLPFPIEETGDYKSVEWISQQLQQKRDKPFFLAAGIYRPHVPWYAPQEYFDKFPIEDIQLPVVLATDLKDVPEEGQRIARNRYHERVIEAGLWKEAVQGYLASISYADALVGKLLADLEASPHAGNTIVVIFSDHGWQLGEKEHWRKFALWENVLNTVLMVRVPEGAPGLAAGSLKGGVCDGNVSLMDVFPMLTELAGVDPKSGISGRSLVPLLESPDRTWDYPVVSIFGERHYSVIDGDWHYIRYEEGGEELYDLASDPNEWTNLADLLEHRERKAGMATFIPERQAPLIETQRFRWSEVLTGEYDLYHPK